MCPTAVPKGAVLQVKIEFNLSLNCCCTYRVRQQNWLFFPEETNWLFVYPTMICRQNYFVLHHTTVFLETRNYTKHVTMFQNVDVNI